jgi:WD40 repeat protein
VRFDAATGKEKWTIPAGRAKDLTFEQDGKSIRFYGHIDESEQNECWRWLDADTGKPLPRTMEAEHGYSHAIRPDGKVIAIGGYYGHIAQWDLQTRNQLDASADPVGLVADLYFNPDGTKIRGFSRGWYEWDVQTGKQTRLTPPLDVFATYDIAVSRDQKWLAWSPRRERPRVHVKDLASGRPPQLLGHAYYQECLRFLPNGRLAVTYGDGESLRHDLLTVYRLATGSPDFYLFVNREKQAFAISPDGESAIVMSVAEDHFQFKMWNLATTERSGESIGRLDDPSLMKKSFNWNVQLSANAKRVAVTYTYLAFEGMGFNSITEDHTAVFDVRTGRFLSTWVDLPHRASVAFSPDGRSVACYFRSILGIDIREAATGGRRARISDLSTVSDACFTPDGSKLAVAASPGPIVLYNLLKTNNKWDAKNAASLWDGLASNDAEVAFNVICLLRANAAQAIPFLKERMKVATKPSAEWIAARIRDLDAAEFRKREVAGVDLAAEGEVILPELLRALAKATPEARERLTALIAKVQKITPDKLRAIRACEALEGIASDEAKALLAEWAKGPASATLTREAGESMGRLRQR